MLSDRETDHLSVPRLTSSLQGGVMSTCHPPNTPPPESTADELFQLKKLLRDDPAFAEALRSTETTEEAARLVCQHGLDVTPEALWRNRGTLESCGRPTWRG